MVVVKDWGEEETGSTYLMGIDLQCCIIKIVLEMAVMVTQQYECT